MQKTDRARNKIYGGPRADYAFSVVQTGDGGYAIAGYTWSFGAGNQDFWLIKLAGPEIPATVNINPATLNLKSTGKWITAYIELPEGYNVGDIDISTVRLNGEIAAELHPTEIGDYDGDGVTDLMVKFDRQELIDILGASEAALIITGEVNGTPFEGSDTIRVID